MYIFFGGEITCTNKTIDFLKVVGIVVRDLVASGKSNWLNTIKIVQILRT